MSEETILDPQEVDHETVAIYRKSFTTEYKARKSLGSIPPEVHAAVIEKSTELGMQVGQYIASLMRFRKQYEEDYAEYLEEQRAKNPTPTEVF